MNVPSLLLWGFVATALITSLLATGQHLGFTRMSMPFLLGTALTPNRDRALLLGMGVHLLNGWVFALIYAAAFERLGAATWWMGALMGLLHGVFVLTVVMPLVPSFHPRMVSQFVGPTPNRRLQPPGFMGLNYGPRTPLVALAAHVLYGAVLGIFYQLR
jgi:hypothetical protein